MQHDVDAEAQWERMQKIKAENTRQCMAYRGRLSYEKGTERRARYGRLRRMQCLREQSLILFLI